MSAAAPLTPEAVLRNYFHAKDENRPRLLASAFAEDAVLEVRNDSTAIAFPARTTGREAIADVFVRALGQTYENVYSFYLDRPGAAVQASFGCGWLVVMTEKASRGVRVGCGRYEWDFRGEALGLASRLAIRIAAMQVLQPGASEAVYAATSRLAYPWSSRDEAATAMAGVSGLAPIVEALTST